MIATREPTSLASYLRVMFITWPSFANVSINSEQVTNLENPFNLVPLESYKNHSAPDFCLKTTKSLTGDFQGVFIYKVNRLVRIIKVMQTVQMGKRTFREANLSLSGIVTVFPKVDTTLDKTVS